MHHFLDSSFDPNSRQISREEAEHAQRVLRLKDGAAISLGDGQGNVFIGSLKIEGKAVSLLIENQTYEAPSRNPITLCIAPPKNPARFEWLLEKATEIGVDRIIPIFTRRTERLHHKEGRAERIIHAATKQCKRRYLPEMLAIHPFEDAVQIPKTFGFIAHCVESSNRRPFAKTIADLGEGSRHILIGPEGDFHPDEIDAALANGYEPVDLGSNRLRTETAGIFVLGILVGMR